MPNQSGKSDDVRVDDPDALFNALDADVEAANVTTPTSDPDMLTLRRRSEILEQMLRVSTALNSTVELEDLLVKVVTAVVDITDCKRGYLMLADDDGALSPVVGRSREGHATLPSNPSVHRDSLLRFDFLGMLDTG